MHSLQQLLSGELAGTTRLKLSCGLTTFPEEIFSLADTLEILDLSGNRLSELPVNFGLLKNLKIAFFSDNEFTVLPEVLSHCPGLDIIGFKANRITHVPEAAIAPHVRWLILTNNRIAELPASIGKCVRLQKCMLAGNRLTRLPPEMAACTSLELLRIAANRITVLPDWLYHMPRLSWLAIAGNPCCSIVAEDIMLEEIPWAALVLQAQLGEGASGFVYRALWQSAPGTEGRGVAVKLFKGEVTSDGLPGEEMNIAIRTGKHASLVQVLGKITGHPEQKQGLVFQLIPPACTILGNPPSFITCTRDTFPPGTSFSLSKIITVAQAIASAAAHLHSIGIMHGDLYCHNILTDDDGNVLLVDCGAASNYNIHDDNIAAFFQRMEVRAFGCLIDDLLTFINISDGQQQLVARLEAVRNSCMQENVEARPYFNSLSEELLNIAEMAGINGRF